MELRHYRYFWTIAVEGTISKAATRLNITQPTLSRQLKEMEAELGVELFQREKKQLVLTPAGHYLKERAEEILSLAEKTEQEFLDQRQELFSGHLTIGCVEADNSDTLAMILEEFLNDYPQVTFSIFSSTSDEITTKLDMGLLDVAVLLQPVAAEKYEQLLLPRKETWGLLVGKGTFLAEKAVITPADIPGVPLLLPRRPETQALLAAWSGLAVANLNVRGNFNLIFNAFSLVENHVAAAFAIRGAATYHHSEQCKFVPLSPSIETQCVFVWKGNRAYTPVVREFIKRMNHAFKA